MAKKLYITIFRHVRKIAKNDYSLRHVCPSVHMEDLSTSWTDYHSFFKSFEKIQDT
jgi:hypothetical protein